MADANTPTGEQTGSTSVSQGESNARAKIGQWVTVFALVVVGLLGFVAICVALTGGSSTDQKFGYVKDILAIILPLVGTWVGTVLAFYFSKENFVEAAKQTSNLVKQLTTEQKLQSISAADVMLQMDDANTEKLVLSAPAVADSLNLKTDIIDAHFEKHSRNRLPIVDSSSKVLYVLHRSFIDKFIAQSACQPSVIVGKLTLADILAIDEYKNAFVSFATIAKTAKLLSAKEAMDGNPDCSDVFVTDDGTRNTKAVGWITNVIVTENAKI